MRKDYVIRDEEDGRHLRSLLEELLVNIPAKGIRRAIQRGQILVNKSRVASNHKVAKGDQIFIHIQTTRKRRSDFEIPVVQEDADYALINKPAGLIAGGGREASVSDFLIHILQPSGAKDALPIPKSVHRLDKPTSGLMIVAKTKAALTNLSQQFEDRTVQKTYTALVHNHIQKAGKINITISEKEALTHYTPVRKVSTNKGYYTVVELKPKTGRTHQLRRHMAYIGHPIVGDCKYGKSPKDEHALMLCATKLTFQHPLSKLPVECEISLPPNFDIPGE